MLLILKQNQRLIPVKQWANPRLRQPLVFFIKILFSSFLRSPFNHIRPAHMIILPVKACRWAPAGIPRLTRVLPIMPRARTLAHATHTAILVKLSQCLSRVVHHEWHLITLRDFTSLEPILALRFALLLQPRLIYNLIHLDWTAMAWSSDSKLISPNTKSLIQSCYTISEQGQTLPDILMIRCCQIDILNVFIHTWFFRLVIARTIEVIVTHTYRNSRLDFAPLSAFGNSREWEGKSPYHDSDSDSIQ